MEIWVDADACPVAIKEILFRAAERTETKVTLVANQYINTPRSKFVSCVQVSKGFDVADNEIVIRSAKGDLVITSDIPLANEVISKGCLALSPRGELFTEENIKARLNIRDSWKPCGVVAYLQEVPHLLIRVINRHLGINLIDGFRIEREMHNANQADSRQKSPRLSCLARLIQRPVRWQDV